MWTSACSTSVEVPKGTGMNYSDGITPFVLAKINNRFGTPVYLMETGYRERQTLSPFTNRIMRFEPRPGWFQADPLINRGRSPAMSHDPRTWPPTWPDKLTDPDDPGWPGSWDGYFGKRPAADQESYTVMDDDYYDAFAYYPDSRDSTRHGLGLRVGVRRFQWSNPQAGNVIFWHYEIANEGTTDYDQNIVFGLYMDSGVGGSSTSCDFGGIAESDDDNAFFDRSLGLNLTYTWDTYGHGVDLAGNCEHTGYLGYAYLETPGNRAQRDRRRPRRHHRRDPRPCPAGYLPDRVRGHHGIPRDRSGSDLLLLGGALRHHQVHRVLWTPGRPSRLPRGFVVDPRRGHGLARRLQRRRRRRRAGHARHRRGRREARARASPTSTAQISTSPTRSGSPASR